nr:hypothetical protein [Tanacetum cinerariifolium]
RCLFELGKVGRACGSRGKWWSGTEMRESGAVSGGGKNGEELSTARHKLMLLDTAAEKNNAVKKRLLVQSVVVQ